MSYNVFKINSLFEDFLSNVGPQYRTSKLNIYNRSIKPKLIKNSNDDLRKLCSSNPDIAYANDKVTLITYEERHVASYHEWMDDDETREMTCSERMTLDEEYKTRKQWAEHKYCGTFLIMDSKKFVESNGSEVQFELKTTLLMNFNLVGFSNWRYKLRAVL